MRRSARSSRPNPLIPSPADLATGDVSRAPATGLWEERPGDTRRITSWLEERFPHVEAEVHHGGQPLYPYLFSIE